MSIPSTVQAITIAKQGDFDVIEKTAIPFKVKFPSDIVVKVEYAGVNFIDTYFRAGLYPLALPATLGMEAAGTIVALPTDESVLKNPAFKKRAYAIGAKAAVMNLGVFAEYVSVPWNKVFPVPEQVPVVTAAAALLQGITAITLATESYNIKQGDTILVHTIAGGVGLLFAQIAKTRGATVIGTTSTPEKAALAKQHGADHVILYKSEDVVQRVKEITGGQGVDAIFDGVGKDTFEQDFEMIKRKGTLVSFGNASGAIPPFGPLKLTPKNLKFLRPSAANYIVTPEEVTHYGSKLFSAITDGSLKFEAVSEYPFTAEGVKQSQIDLTGGKTTGKLVIKF